MSFQVQFDHIFGAQTRPSKPGSKNGPPIFFIWIPYQNDRNTVFGCAPCMDVFVVQNPFLDGLWKKLVRVFKKIVLVVKRLVEETKKPIT